MTDEDTICSLARLIGDHAIGLDLTEKGMRVGAVLSLIIGGAGASIPELTLLAAIFEKKLLAAFVLTIFTIAVTAGYLANLLTV